jgi:hypothetical protein
MVYLKNVLVGLDQMANAVLGGWPDETFSARCWRCREKQPWKVLRAVNDGPFFFQRNHCQSAFESERLRMQSPVEERCP